MGWVRVRTQRGVVMTGSRSVRYRSISKETDPDPMITEALNATVGTPEPRRIASTSARDLMWGEGRSAGVRPPR